MIEMNCENIVFIHKMILSRYGGEDGVRDTGLLDSSLNSPYQTFDGEDIYPSNLEKGIRMSFNLVMNHCFNDGNKRIGFMVLVLFLEDENLTLVCSHKEIIDKFFSLASGQLDYSDFKDWVMVNKSAKTQY